MDQLPGITQITNSPCRILSLDGGGIRGLSSLIILEEIMRKVAEAEKEPGAVRPCDYFDLIGGTSTGGIIALMLGRLEMTVDACIRAYRKLAAQAFTPKFGRIFPASPRGTFSAKALESAMKQVIRENCVETSCREQRSRGIPTGQTCPHEGMMFYDDSSTKTVVVAITKENVNAPPTLLKSYDSSTNFRSCSIWEIARATSAATTFFESIRIGRDEIEFIDAGFGYNNPCELLIREAERIFPADRELNILSIGTGIGDVVAIKDKRLSIIQALKKMATSSSKVETSLYEKYGDAGRYYRFAVNEGLGNVALSDWELTSQISAHTHNYLKSQQKRIELCVRDSEPNITNSLEFLGSESEGDATREPLRDIGPPDIPKPATLIQRGSLFNSIIRCREVEQGNRLEINNPELPCDLVQEGSYFKCQIQAERAVQQGNHISL
ncbi:acyl transferase/acyl hydrolase/lysophospholipase [Xylaria cf. heliscus]|nr:acyl transferase/acyl hydrolase/lysophospholipase [Xylaria cf. heliscus]